jgi:membrane peptidoglycan carboxypeptidase
MDERIMSPGGTMKRIILILFAAVAAYALVTIAEGYVRAPSVLATRAPQAPLALGPQYLTDTQLRILLTVEDPSFFTHHGVDLTTPGAGMTTITQGLVKILYFDSFKPGIAKIRQTLLAIGFDARASKQLQLGLFLKAVYLGTWEGRRILGFENAAQAYFGRGVMALSTREFTSLVAMCIAPNQFHVRAAPRANAERVARIERLLRGDCRARGLRDVYYEDCAHRPSTADDARMR